MGSALGATVEGDSASVIENKPTNSSTPFMTIFDEVGYYTAQGMAVMAAHPSLGFCLIFSAQDLPALEKRVKEEARSIAANCNIKIFGKLEDPTQTKEFFEKTVGSSFVTEVSGFQTEAGSMSHTYGDNYQASVQTRARANYNSVRQFVAGQAVVAFGESVIDVRIFYTAAPHAKAMRVTRYIPLPPPDEAHTKHMKSITALRDLMIKKDWTASKADVSIPTTAEIAALANSCILADEVNKSPMDAGVYGLASVYSITHPIDMNAPDEPVAPPQQSAEPAQAATAAPAGPMGFFPRKMPMLLFQRIPKGQFPTKTCWNVRPRKTKDAMSVWTAKPKTFWKKPPAKLASQSSVQKLRTMAKVKANNGAL